VIAGQSTAANSSVEVNPKGGASPSAFRIFFLFASIDLFSFGGAVPGRIRRAFVEVHGRLGEREFSAALALARLMPGVNVVSLAVLVGNRLRGGRGAAAAIGLLLVVIGLDVLCRQFAGSSLFPALFSGTTAAAVGLLIAMAVSSGARLASPRKNSEGRTTKTAGAIVFLMVTFILVGVLRFPTLPIVLCVAPLSIAVAFSGRHNSAEETG
jgi:chromate transporter